MLYDVIVTIWCVGTPPMKFLDTPLGGAHLLQRATAKTTPVYHTLEKVFTELQFSFILYRFACTLL